MSYACYSLIDTVLTCYGDSEIYLPRLTGLVGKDADNSASVMKELSQLPLFQEAQPTFSRVVKTPVHSMT